MQHLESPHHRWLVLIAVMLAFTPIIIDMTILHIAVPSLTLELGASGTDILWIIDIYPLLMAGLLVSAGTLADRTGYRRMILIGLVIFGIASCIAAMAQTPTMLIAGRALQAIGASMVMPCVLALIRIAFTDDKERAFALGVWTTVASAGAAFGPLTGGFLLEHFWWGSVFLINVPILMIVIPACLWILPKDTPQSSESWNAGQALLLISGLISLVYGIKSGLRGTESPLIPMLIFSFGLILIAIFTRFQFKSHNPMLDLSLFTRPVFTMGLLMALLAAGGMAGFELLLAQELQFVFDKTPLQAGMFMMPLIIAFGISGPLASALNNRFGLRNVSFYGLLLAALGMAALSQTHLGGSPYPPAICLLCIGFGLGSALLSSSVAIMGAAPPEKAGAAGSLEATGYELGAGLGITLFGVLLGAIYQASFIFNIQGTLLAQNLKNTASHSIGETFIIAQKLPVHESEALKAIARTAFSSAHSTVLLTAATLIGSLAFVVFGVLRNVDTDMPASH